jgi:Fur family transcriptional regulator, ferric uptake regulator
MDQRIELFKARLKHENQSVTAARLAVFEAMLDQEPLTMHELVQRCIAIDRASVYRTAALFEKLGIAERLNIGWKYKLELTDAFHHHHHHMTCISCSETVTITEDDDLERHLIATAANNRFQMASHQIEIKGYCENCQKS